MEMELGNILKFWGILNGCYKIMYFIYLSMLCFNQVYILQVQLNYWSNVFNGTYTNGSDHKPNISSVESQKGTITIQRCSVENQNGAVTIDFVQW